MERKSVKEFLYKQLELLAEESKNVCPASNELSQNSLAMVEISKELFKRKCSSAVYFIALCYFIKCFTVHRK